MEDILKEFKIVFGLDSEPMEQGLKKAESSLQSFGKIFGGIVASYFSYEIFKGIIQGYAEFNTQLSQNLALTGGDAGEVMALGNALKRFGGNTDSVINSLKSLNGHLQEARFGGGALVDVAMKYGLVVNKYDSAEKTIMNLAKQMGRYDRQTRVAIASQLGLDDAMVRAFADGGKELEKLVAKQKELGVITEEDIKISNQFNNAILDLQDLFGALTRDLARVVVPVFTKIVDLIYSFVEYIRKHKVLVLGFFAALLVALSPILLALGKMAIASIAAFAPFYAIIGVVTALALIFEDVYYYFKGWDSASGVLVKRFPVLKGVLDFIKPIVVGIVDTFSALIDFLKDPCWDKFVNIFKVAGNAIVEFIKTPFEWLSNTLGSLIERFPILSVVLEPVKAVVDAIIDAFKWLIDAVTNFSLDGLLAGFSKVKDTVLDIGKSVLDAINPLNWFSDDEKKAASSGGGGGGVAPAAPVVIAEAPAIPQASSVVNSSTSSNTNNYNINNNINQNISSATPKQLADGTNQIMINSINAQRQQKGAL